MYCSTNEGRVRGVKGSDLEKGIFCAFVSSIHGWCPHHKIRVPGLLLSNNKHAPRKVHDDACYLGSSALSGRFRGPKVQHGKKKKKN